MARRSSSSMEVLLGLLTIESMSGYDLGLTIRSSVGHFWNESYGQIYPNLKKLAAEGFVSSRSERQSGAAVGFSAKIIRDQWNCVGTRLAKSTLRNASLEILIEGIWHAALE